MDPALNEYTDCVLLHHNPTEGLSVYRANAVAGPVEKVICKIMEKSADSLHDALLNEYSVLKAIHAHHAAKEAPRPSIIITTPTPQRRISQRLRSAHSPVVPIMPPILDEQKLIQDSSELLSRIPRVVAFEDFEDKVMLVLEDFQGDSLHTVLRQGKLQLYHLLQIATQVAEALDLVHQAHFTHLSLNPNHISLHFDESGSIRCQLTSFGSAVNSIFDTDASLLHLGRVQGSPTYISPEQTGRTERRPDCRSDFYSLGITLWEVAVGHPPFVAEDIAELVYSHMAREIADVQTFNPLVPNAVSKIISKLIKKDPSDRYHTARGLLSDLKEIGTLLNEAGYSTTISDTEFCLALQGILFDCGKNDYSPNLVFDEKVYGREVQLEAFEKVYNEARGEDSSIHIVCVRGSAGAGKSAFVTAIERKVAETDGFFVRPKLPFTGNDRPLDSILTSLEILTRYLLVETNEILDAWNQKIREIVSQDMFVNLCTLIPSLRSVLGILEHASLGNIDLSPSNKDLFIALEGLFRVFVGPGKVMVVFLGELKNDHMTLGFLHFLIQRQQLHSVIFLTTEKQIEQVDNVNAMKSPLFKELESSISYIDLGPISVDAVFSFLSSVIRPPGNDLRDLSRLLFRKTSGNPYHLIELLRYCESSSMIRFDHNKCQWAWSLSELDQKTEITANVIDILMFSFQMLPLETQEALKKAACFGVASDLKVLGQIFNTEAVVLEQAFRPALQMGLLISTRTDQTDGSVTGSLSSNLQLGRRSSAMGSVELLHPKSIKAVKFSHVKVRDAVYNGIDSEKRAEIHLNIARYLFQQSKRLTVADAQWHACLSHYNNACFSIPTDEEKWKVIELNLQSYRSCPTFTSARTYVFAAESLFNSLKSQGTGEQFWETQPDRMSQVMDAIFSIAVSENDLVKAQSIHREFKTHVSYQQNPSVAVQAIYLLSAQSRFDEALLSGLDALRSSHMVVPSEEEISEYIEGLKSQLSNLLQSKENPYFFIPADNDGISLCDGPDLLYWATSLAARQVGNLKLSLYISLTAAISHFNKPISKECLFHMATCLQVFVGGHGKIDSSSYQRLCELVMEYVSYLTGIDKAIVNIASKGAMDLYKREEFDDWKLSFQVMKEEFYAAGLSWYLGECGLLELSASLSNGRGLNEISDLTRQFWNIDGHLTDLMTGVLSSLDHFNLDMGGRVSIFLGDELLRRSAASQSRNHGIGESILLYFQLVVAATSNQLEEARRLQRQLNDKKCILAGSWAYVDILMFDICLMAHEYQQVSLERDALKTRMQESLSVLDTLTSSVQNSDSNGNVSIHRFKYQIALAEFCHSTSDMARALNCYEEALEGSRTSQMLLFEAWINELQGKFWMKQHSKRLARTSILTSIQLWARWGSEKMVVELKSQHAEILAVPRGSSAKKSKTLTAIITKEGREDRRDLSSPLRSAIDDQSFFPYSMSSSTLSRTLLSSVASSSQSNIAAASAKLNTDLDITTVLRVSASLTNEKTLDDVLNKILTHLMQNAGATKAFLLLNEQGKLVIQAEAEDNASAIEVRMTNDITSQVSSDKIPLSIINYVFRTQEPVVFMETPDEPAHRKDTYIDHVKPKSILCCPIRHQNQLTGLVYMENTIQSGSFTPARVEFVKSLLASASVSIENTRLLKKNTELTQALKETEKKDGRGPRYNLDAPIKHVLDTVQSIKSRFAKNDPIMAKLDEILTTLLSEGLFSANIDEINDENGQALDQDTKTWIESSLLQKSSIRAHAYPAGPINPNSGDVIPRSSSSSVGSNVAPPPVVFYASASNSFTEQALMNTSEIEDQLEKSLNPDFDVFKLKDASGGNPLYYLVLHMLHRSGLVEHFALNEDMLRNYFAKVEASYHHLPYHNSTHAADVLQTACTLLLTSEVADKLSKVDIFSLILACAVHDLDHPGLNNAYLVQVSHPLAILYNDTAVLESHHVSRAFELAQSSDSNLFCGLPGDVVRQIRKSVIGIVLATDLAQHFQIINKFKGKLSTGSFKFEEDAADRQLLMEMAIKCGDLGNPAKKFDDAKKWTLFVMEEFFRQGDKERSMNIPISKFMDRNDTNIPKCQIGFIDVLVTPLFDAWGQFSKSEFTKLCLSNLSLNRKQWQLFFDQPDLFETSCCQERNERPPEVLDLDLLYAPVSFSRRTSANPGELVASKVNMQLSRSSILAALTRATNVSKQSAGNRRFSIGSSGSIPHRPTIPESNSHLYSSTADSPVESPLIPRHLFSRRRSVSGSPNFNASGSGYNSNRPATLNPRHSRSSSGINT